MSYVGRVGAALVLAVLLAGCASTDNGARLMTASGPIAYQIGDRRVTTAEVEQRMREQFGDAIEKLVAQNQTKQQITDLANQQNVRQNFLDQMIQEELLSKEAQRLGIGIDPKQVDAAVAQQASQASQAGQEAAPVSSNTQQQRLDTARQQLRLEVIAHYITTDQFNSRHILVETEAEAKQIQSQLQQGADFATLARQQSKDPGSAVKGGELGWVGRGNFVPEFEQAAFDEKNALNTPIIVKSQFGYHVIEVEGREKNRPFTVEQLQQMYQQNSQQFQQLYSEQFLPKYEQLRKDAEARGELKVLVDANSLALPFPPNAQ